MVVFGQRWLFLEKVVVFVQSGCIHAKVIVLGKVDLYVQKGSNLAKWLYSGKSGCFPLKYLYSLKVVVFVEN